MSAREFEGMLGRLMKQDLSAGSEQFRDDLLARCLEALGSDNRAAFASFDGAEVGDTALDLLAAAGDATAPEHGWVLGDNGTSGQR